MVGYLDSMDGFGLRPKAGPYAAEKSPLFEVARPSVMDRLKSRREERDNRKADAAKDRIARHLDALGTDWRVLDLQQAAGAERMTFLTVGPTGLFAVTVKDHGRARISFAGDVVQIAGRRPKYVQEARRNAELAAAALTRTTGLSIPVVAVLAFAGTGLISAYGLPKGVIVTSYGELPRVLNGRGRRLAPSTVNKLYRVASSAETWIASEQVPLSERYALYPGGNGWATLGSPDKGATAG